ncbi:AMP-binding enzyme C-terminal domain [Popillia japonica]|uniref:AMP-binding enzyme C-terminal domain n=1 Tax=Popillia japonica TaxID=7064 RepID=A0AAW1LTR1_POPJA
MSVISRILVRNILRSTCNVSCANQKGYSSQTIEENCLKSKSSDVYIPEITLAEYLVNNFSKFPNKIAVECGVTKRKYTFDDVLVKSSNLNKNFRKKLKLQKGDVVAFFMPNVPEFFITTIGVHLAGLKLTTINSVYTPDEIKRQLVDSGAKVLVTLPELWQNAKKAVEETKNSISIITIKNKNSDTTPTGAIDWAEFANTPTDIPDAELPSIHETIYMPYSSGTTGLPKGVELSSYNIVANIAQIRHPDFNVVESITDTHQDVTIAILPLFHIYGFTCITSMMTDGAKVVTLPKFTPDGYMNSLRDYRPHVLMIVPPIVIFLYSHPNVQSEYLSSLRTVFSGAAPLGALDEEKLRRKVGKPFNVLQGYGLSETSPVVTVIPLSLQGKYPGSMGSAIPNTLLKVVKIDDNEGKHLPPHTNGELLIKGPQVMKGYYNQPEQTKNTFLNGWFKSGDIVRYNEDGMLYSADRLKELIKVKGLQVPPAELEEIIRDYPGVLEAAVIGIPHERHGEVPRAYVVAKENYKIDVDKLRKQVESKVAKHKRLEGGIVIVEEIPKNASGKLMRRKLKSKYLEEKI